MKRTLLTIVVLLLLALGYFAFKIGTTKNHSPEDRVLTKVGSLEISVVYCRPYKKGRKIFGGLVPFDTYWRTGANGSTEIQFSQNVSFGGKALPAGRYKLYTIPSASSWSVVLNSELGTWGYEEPNYEMDVLQVDAPVNKLPGIVEQFSISFSEIPGGAEIHFAWDGTEVRVPILSTP